MKAPPPVASTCGPLSNRRAITRASPLRKSASPCRAKISEMLMPAASFDLRVGVDEGDRQARRQPAADRRFADPHHADENNRAAVQHRTDGGREGPVRIVFYSDISHLYLSLQPAGRLLISAPGRLALSRTRSGPPAPIGCGPALVRRSSNSLRFGRDFAYGLRTREPHRHRNPHVLADSSRERGPQSLRTSQSEQSRCRACSAFSPSSPILCGGVYGGLYSLAHFVRPSSREMSVSVSPAKFYKDH